MRTWVLLTCIGCGAPAGDTEPRPVPEPDSDVPVDTAPTADTAPTLDSGPTSTPTVCADLVDQETFTVDIDGVAREVLVHRPEAPSGAALLFWYGAGQSPEIATQRANLAALAAEHGVLVLVPDHVETHQTTWLLELDGPDVALFDRLVDCALEAGAAPDRVHLGGFSIGALFSAYVLQHRADRVASVVSASGGIDQSYTPWQPPSADVPVVLTWGGPADVNGAGTQFDPLNLELAQLLRDAGHLVVECVHDEGHSIPAEMYDLLVAWTQHVAGEPSPWATTTAGLPAICAP